MIRLFIFMDIMIVSFNISQSGLIWLSRAPFKRVSWPLIWFHREIDDCFGITSKWSFDKYIQLVWIFYWTMKFAICEHILRLHPSVKLSYIQKKSSKLLKFPRFSLDWSYFLWRTICQNLWICIKYNLGPERVEKMA